MKITPLEPVYLTEEDIAAMHDDWLRTARKAGHVKDPKYAFNPPRLVTKDGRREWQKSAKERARSYPKA